MHNDRMYDPDRIAAYFDEYGAREWDRLERSPVGRVNLELHRRFLVRLVHAGDHVLEVGAGPGRFTIQLAQLGARVTVASRELADVIDLGRFEDWSFDVTTAYGGPLLPGSPRNGACGVSWGVDTCSRRRGPPSTSCCA
jgi:SAM-dependent methyltransferase